jgi:hypothetical protein
MACGHQYKEETKGDDHTQFSYYGPVHKNTSISRFRFAIYLLSSQIISAAMSAGETPEILDA